MSTGLIAKTADQLMTEMKAVPFAKKARYIGDLCDALKPKLSRACQNGLTFERVRNAAIRLACNGNNVKLFEADPESLIAAINEAAGYGWEVGGVLAQAYLVPYAGSVQMQPGYKGLLDLAYRGGQVLSVTCECVHEGDDFRYVSGDDERIDHTPTLDANRHMRPIKYVYAVVRLKSGGAVRAVMTREAIDAHKEAYSKAWNRSDSAWRTNWPAMAKKTVLKQVLLRGGVPMSMETQRLVQREYDDTPEATTFDAVAFAVEEVDLGPQAVTPSSVGRVEAQARDAAKQLESVESKPVTLDEFRRALADATDGKALAAVAARMADLLPEADKPAGRDAYAARRVDLRAASDGARGDQP